MMLTVEYILAVAITLAIFSLALKENISVSIVEHLAIAVGGGYAL